MEKLLSENEKIIYSIANEYDNKSPVLEVSDLFQIGSMAFCKAVKKYDPSRKTKLKAKLSTFAHKIIENAIIDEIKKETKQKHLIKQLAEEHRKENNISKQQHHQCDGICEEYSSRGIDCSPEELYFMQERPHQIMELVHTRLPNRERDMIIRRFGLDGRNLQTQSEIAQDYNLTEARVSQIINNALKVLRYIIETNPQSKIYIWAR